MYSRSLLAITAIALFPASGCWFRIGEHPPEPKGAELVGGADSECLSESTNIIQDYFKGVGDPTHVDRMWKCASRSLQFFAERTRGSTSGSYSTRELRDFLQRYFLGNLKVSDELADKAMELKQTILGGQPGTVTLLELEKTRQLIDVIRVEMLRLQPYMPLTLDQLQNVDEETLKKATETLISAAENLGHAIDGAQGVPYSFEQLAKFLVSLQGFYSGDGPIFIYERIPFLRAIKGIISGPSSEVIAGNEWSHVLSAGARWYVIALKANRFAKTYSNFNSGKDHETLMALLKEIRGELSAGISRYPDGTIPFTVFDQLIDSIDKLYPGIIPIKTHVAKNFLRPLFMRILGGPDPGPEGRDTNGLTNGLLGRVWSTLAAWSWHQRNFETAFLKLSNGDLGSLTGPGYTQEELIGEMPVSDFTHVIRDYQPLFGVSGLEIYLSGDRRHTFHNLSMMNLFYRSIQLVLSGYAENPGRARTLAGITQAELSRLIDDIRDVGVELKLMNMKNLDTLPARRFREANLFTFASNGDGLYNIDEATQHLGFMVSAKHMGIRIHDSIAAICHATEPDDFDSVQIDSWCYHKTFFDHFKEYFNNIPRIADYYAGLSGNAKHTFEINLEIAGRGQGHLMETVTSDHTDTFVGVIQFLETVFTRFDTDKSNSLNLHETSDAFPIFLKTLKGFPQLSSFSDSQTKAIFEYLVSFGELPENSIWGQISFIWWSIGDRSFSSDRGKLLAVFSELGKIASPK